VAVGKVTHVCSLDNGLFKCYLSIETTERNFVLNKKQTEEFFQKLEQKYGLPTDYSAAELQEKVGGMLRVEEIRDISDEFNLDLDVVRNLTILQYCLIMNEISEKGLPEPSFEQEQACSDYFARIEKAGGIVTYLKQLLKKKPPEISPSQK